MPFVYIKGNNINFIQIREEVVEKVEEVKEVQNTVTVGSKSALIANDDNILRGGMSRGRGSSSSRSRGGNFRARGGRGGGRQ